MVKERNPKPLILSVDDDENAHILLQRAFAKAGSHAMLATVDGGEQAIRYFEGSGEFSDRRFHPLPQVMLLDLKMPKVTGFDVLEFMQQKGGFSDIHVIVFSSSNNEKDVRRAYELGCDFYVVKPTTFDQLIELVRAIDLHFFATNKPMSESEKRAVPFPDFVLERPSAPLHSLPVAELPLRDTSVSHPPEMFKLLIEQIQDYAICLLDQKGGILTWNEGARRIRGYETDEVVGKNFAVFYSAQDIEGDKPCRELQLAEQIGKFEDEGWRVRKDGSRFWANVVITALRGPQGELLGFADVTRDLTQRKIQEEGLQKLLESEERFKLLVEQVKDYAIFILDAKGNVASWNLGARRIKGYSPEEIIGKHFSTFYMQEDIDTDKPARELTIAIREGRYEEEGWRVRKDGTRFWASVVITALWDKRGNLTGFAKVTRDLTERKREEDALRTKTEELEAFAHTLSHDLRSPLRSISSFAQLLRTEAREISEQEREQYLDKILRAAQSMDTLVNGILKISELSLAPTPREKIALDDIMDECLFLLEGEIQEKKAKINIDRPLPAINGNRVLLVQIFSNLLANALKFVPEGQKPEVHIYAVFKDGDCEVHMQDNGVGIAEKFHETIFNAFDRGAAERETSGMGVGLAIVRKAAERLGGEITLKSQEGKGSDFILKILCDPKLHKDLRNNISRPKTRSLPQPSHR